MTQVDASSTVKLEAGRYGRIVLARLKPNEDIVRALERLCADHGIRRAVVRSAVGSLIDGHLESGAGVTLATRIVPGPGVEIVGLFGEIECTGEQGELPGTSSSALTAILSGTDSQVFAGRLTRGANLSFITVEVTLQEWIAEGAIE